MRKQDDVGRQFFTADLHISHGNILKYCRRMRFMNDTERELISMADEGTLDAAKIKIGQESIERMNDYLIDQINVVVNPTDILWIVGDAFWGRDFKRMRELRDRIRCQNLNLVWGNHDPEWIAPLFNYVCGQKLIKVDGQAIFLNHYPMRSWDRAHHSAWHLYGHVHGLYYEEDLNAQSYRGEYP